MADAVEYQRKPLRYAAKQFDGTNAQEIIDWIESEAGQANLIEAGEVDNGDGSLSIWSTSILVFTNSGSKNAFVGNYIIQGALGDFFILKAAVFEAEFVVEGANPNVGLGWFEWFDINAGDENNAHLAYALENGGIRHLVWEVDIDQRFLQSFEQGKAHRLIRADGTDVTKGQSVQDDPQ